MFAVLTRIFEEYLGDLPKPRRGPARLRFLVPVCFVQLQAFWTLRRKWYSAGISFTLRLYHSRVYLYLQDKRPGIIESKVCVMRRKSPQTWLGPHRLCHCHRLASKRLLLANLVMQFLSNTRVGPIRLVQWIGSGD